jgi:hypothetical protein
MASDTAGLQRELDSDLAALGDRVADEHFAAELYRALANRTWSKSTGEAPGHVALSWSRAEALVNELRRACGADPLTLAQTGGEGELTPDVRTALEALGWTSGSLNTGRADPAHVDAGASPPPAAAASGGGGPDPAAGWEQEAHAEAEANRRRRA